MDAQENPHYRFQFVSWLALAGIGPGARAGERSELCEVKRFLTFAVQSTIMTATLVHVQVRPEFIHSFIEATRENHDNSVKEQGNFRFDILQDAADPGKFILYEIFESDEAVLAHKETPHYLKWRDAVTPWMAKPREGVKHKVLFPSSSGDAS
jgi:(4S)-4-hydroxy-5-phosphonooxypentane-2,3-dione isomerase